MEMREICYSCFTGNLIEWFMVVCYHNREMCLNIILKDF